jgi:hypothetical protein
VTVEGVDEFAASELRSPRSVCSTQPATSPRLATALLTAATAIRDFILESIE